MINNQKLDKEQKAFLDILSSCIRQTTLSDLLLSAEEWNRVLSLAGIHNVAALVFEKVSDMSSFNKLPDYTQNKMETMVIVASQVKRTEAFLSLYQKCLKAGLHPIVMKGIVCRRLYGEYCDHRPSGDEDILICKGDYQLIQKIYIENGYFPENANVTPKQLEDLQEITFYNIQSGLTIEVHVNPIGHHNDLRRKMNDYFKCVFERSIVLNINGVNITTMCATDHFLYLVLHSFKHFISAGFGVRQVLDILLFEQEYADEIDWNYIETALKDIRAYSFFADLICIGERYLGFNTQLDISGNCPEELLIDLLGNGAFGNGTQEQRTALQMTNAAVAGNDKNSADTILRTIFPSKALMLNNHPELQERPWLLPICWIKRWGRFVSHNKSNGGNLAAESMKISKRRIELLRKYEIL